MESIEKETPCAAPPPATFDEFFEQYQRRIFNLVYRLVGNYEEAADLTADTFAQALRAFPRFRGDAQAYTWLYRIAVNRCKNYFRQRDRRAPYHGPSFEEGGAAGEELQGRPSADVSPEQAAEAEELQRYLQQCLNALPPHFRVAVVLRDVQGLSYQEIADITESSVEAVKSRLFRARGLLRRQLAPYLHPEV
jgi:RNA polymerase sigma-70 factor (ECF subfamily)